MLHENRRPDVAVFIDFENVYVSVRDKLDANPNFESIMDRCNDLGRVIIARAYADWYRYPRVTSALYANGIEPMYVPTYYYDKEMGRTGRAIKNSVDMNLCIDAMKTLFTHTNVARFVLVTGDRDFIPLVNSIRQQGKEVIIIGIGGAASTHLAQSADEFVFYEQLVGKAPVAITSERQRVRAADAVRPPDVVEVPELIEPPPPPPPAEPDVYDVLVDAIHLVRKRGYVSTLGSLKLVMKELMGGEFKESRYRDLNGRPFAKFKDFVIDAEKRGKVQIFTNGTVNEVFLPGEDPYKLSQFAADLKEPIEPVLDTPVLTNGRQDKVPPAVVEEVAPATSPAGRRRRRRSRSQRQAQQTVEETTQELLEDEPETVAVEPGEPPMEAQADELQALEALEPVAELEAVAEELLPAEIAAAEAVAEAAVETAPVEAVDETVPVEVGETAAPEAVETVPVEAVETAPVEAVEAASVEAEETVAVEAVEAAPVEAVETVAVEAVEAAPVEAVETVPVEAVETVATDVPVETVATDAPVDAVPVEAVEAEETAAPVETAAPEEAAPVEAVETAPVEVAVDVAPEEAEEAPVEAEETVPVEAAEAVEAAPVETVAPEEITPAAVDVVFVPAEALIAETVPVAEQEATATEESAADAQDAVVEEPIIFSDAEWQTFRTLMLGFAKPVSFAQIFDSLRELRKQQQINRTNEQLRTMVKQAINTGMLERSGRGNRIYYRLKQVEE